MGGTPSFELTFFGMERSVPDCLIRLIRDLEQGIISEAVFEPYKVRGAVCYAVEPSEPEGTFAEIREIEEWTDTDPVVKRRRREGDGAIRYRKPYQAVSEAPDGSLNFTGAGDSFGAGFMASYCHSRDVDKAVINGNATASIVIQRPGGCYFKRMPDKQSVEERISSLH